MDTGFNRFGTQHAVRWTMNNAPNKFTEELTDLHAQLMSRAYNLTKHREDAEDLVSDTYIKALTRWEQFQEGTFLKSWVLTIMRNTFYNRVKRRGVAAKALCRIKAESVPKQDLPVDHRVSDELVVALCNLPEGFAKVFILHAEGKTHEEIATELGIPVGTSLSRCWRAKKALKESLCCS